MDLRRPDQMYCKFRSRGFMGIWLRSTPHTSTFLLSCQNLNRKVSSHPKSKAFKKFCSADVTQKGQLERFIRNRKKSRLKGSLFPLSPLNPRRRISQCPTLMGWEWIPKPSVSGLYGLALCAAQIFLWIHFLRYTETSWAKLPKPQFS